MSDQELITEAREYAEVCRLTRSGPPSQADYIDELADALEAHDAEIAHGIFLREFHGDDVWRDSDGTIWVRQTELERLGAEVAALRDTIEKAKADAWDEGRDAEPIPGRWLLDIPRKGFRTWQPAEFVNPYRLVSVPAARPDEGRTE